MTQDEINQMVEQAGFHGMLSIGVVMDSKQLEAFAKLVAAKALAQPEQEPWCMKMNGCKTKCEDCPEKVPQRTWVGLTDEQIWQIATDSTIGSDLHAEKFARAIEAKLKQKNGFAEEKNT